MFLEGADDGGIAGIGQQAERVPEAERGLQRAGVGVQTAPLRVRAPSPGPQGAEIAAAEAP
jgi:hypothetical protein